MKPVLVLQHQANDGPAYLATWLDRHALAWELWRADAGEPLPSTVAGYAGLAVLGGAMSANDPLAHLREEEGLIREAMALGRPVIGHCLGGQLMARALGAAVHASPAPEIGWNTLQVLPGTAAARWFGAAGIASVMHWHYEAFELPAGAVPLARADACEQQAFAIGPHLAMQFHIEADDAKIDEWSREDGALWHAALAAHPGTVQAGAAMRADTPRLIGAQRALADRLYATWAAGLGG